MTENVKAFLYSHLGKQSKTPTYDVKPVPGKRTRFKCELRVDGMNYIGCGNSTNKKDAQTNAARDFLQFLVRSGSIQQAEVPDLKIEYEGSGGGFGGPPRGGFRGGFSGGGGFGGGGFQGPPGGGAFQGPHSANLGCSAHMMYTLESL